MTASLACDSARPDLRERALLSGVHTLADVDLLAILLGSGVEGGSARALAALLLDRSGGLEGLTRLGPHALSDQRGIGPAKAARVAAALELGRRAGLGLLATSGRVIGSFESVVAWARPRLAWLEHEEVWLLALDGRNALKSAQRVAQGGLHGCALTPRDVLRPAVRDAASAFVLVHNHPSGDPSPSPEDVEMTRAVAIGGDVVGIPLLDHVVIARGGAESLLELGALER